MKVLIIGANGNTGFRVARLLSESSHDPVAMIRTPSQRGRFDEIGVSTVLGDLEYPIDHAVNGCDAVVFAAGSGSKTGGDKTVLVDRLGAIRAAVTAQVQSCPRFIMLSAMNVDTGEDSPIAHYREAKAVADEFLRQGDLAWTIVRPGKLHDEPSPGTAEFLLRTEGQVKTSRDTLARVLVACLDEPATIGVQFGLADGETPIEEGLKALVVGELQRD